MPPQQPGLYHNVGEESSALCMASVGVTPEGHVFPIRCKKWSCKVCAPINALHEAIKTANGVYAIHAAGLRAKFVTITQPGSVKTPEFAYRIIDSQWDKFRNRWQYWSQTQGLPNLYAAFVEGQSRRSDMPHFHVIATAMPSQDKVRDWTTSSGLGHQAIVEWIGAHAGVAWYVSKYSTKGSDARYIPKNFRRVRYSQDWPGMYFRSDLLEGQSIVKEPRESYAHWVLRAVVAFGVDPQDTMGQVLAMVDQTQGVVASERVAQAYMVTT